MKITNIKILDQNKIVVTIEEYPHAQPVFPADITAKDLETALKAWKINQDDCDRLNAEAKTNPPGEQTVNGDLKDLIGKEINLK